MRVMIKKPGFLSVFVFHVFLEVVHIVQIVRLDPSLLDEITYSHFTIASRKDPLEIGPVLQDHDKQDRHYQHQESLRDHQSSGQVDCRHLELHVPLHPSSKR